MTTSLRSAESFRDRFVDELITNGHLRSPHWQRAFRTVPRERFVARFTVPTSAGLTEYDLTDPAQYETALEAVYGDHTLITQWDRAGIATSSSSTPSLMGDMLEHLDARPGHRVLEIGTGTGYHAALLAHALGSDAVTSIDVHPALVERARQVLNDLGYTPTVLCGDGANGVGEHAPYERIIATCGADRVPAAWRDQLVPGGVLVVNIGFGLAVLTKQPDGSVSGPFVGTAAFMDLRTDPSDTSLTARDVLAATNATPEHSYDDGPGLDPETFLTPAVGFLRALHYPHLHYALLREEATVYHLYDPTRDSWARATLHDTGRTTVEYHGRDLWHDLHAVIIRWHEHGRPALDRYGLTIQRDGTHLLWLDDPVHHVATV